jgi:hypothetical protein
MNVASLNRTFPPKVTPSVQVLQVKVAWLN